MNNGVEARELYESLMECEGERSTRNALDRWLEGARGGYRSTLARAGEHATRWWEDESEPVGRFLDRELYALNRVSDILLYGYQPPRADGGGVQPWLGLPVAGYRAFFAGLGMTPFDGTGPFDPFLHEIVEVEQSDDPDAPMEITEVFWPGLMLGQLLYVRAGVRIRAGRRHAEAGVADRFLLYWTFRRRARPVHDRSHGWGYNSGWGTEFRLDYRTPHGDRLNVTGDRPIDGDPALPAERPLNLSPEERALTPAERRDLLRHRTLLRTPEAIGALAETDRWAEDLIPYDWRLPEA
ncbi:hypothetical protein [Kitasatospora sp. CB01950]|uniref:hypothetical protein n=1 Tax=Kitasatospora sp. CB01950 TaxID=1703930 RepID=UPI00093FC7BF|nr:hypothetical protein [Kitasatospora sp. CB01950]